MKTTNTYQSKIFHSFRYFLALGTLFTTSAMASNQLEDQLLYSFNLDDLLNIEIVSATQEKQPISKAPAVIDVITATDIQKFRFHSIAEALSTLPGFYFSTDHVNDALSLRGINGGLRSGSRNIKVMINSQPIAFRSTAENFLASHLIPMAAIERIEVIRGPASTLYGANAFLGIINIITKQHQEGEPNIQLAYDQFWRPETSPQWGGVHSIWQQSIGDYLKILASVSTRSFDNSGIKVHESTPELTQWLDAKSRTNAEKISDAKSSGDFSNPLSAYASINYDHRNFASNTDFFYQKQASSGRFYDINPTLNQTEVANSHTYLREQVELRIPDLHLKLQGFLTLFTGKLLPSTVYDISYPIDATSTQVKPDMSYKGYEAGAQADWKIIPQIHFTLGTDYSSEDHTLFTYQISQAANRNTPLQRNSPIASNQKTFTNVGAFSQVLYDVTKELGLSFGIRWDDQNIYGSNVNYRSGAVYAVDQLFSLKLLYGTSYRVPTPMQLYAPTNSYHSGYLYSNEDLIPEQLNSIEVSFSWLGIPKHLLQFNGFYNTLKDMVIYEKVGLTGQIKPSNKDDITTLGFELIHKHQYKQFFIHNNYSWQKSTLQNQAQNADTEPGLFPTQIFNSIATLELFQSTLGVHYKFQSEVLSSKENYSNNTILGRTIRYSLPSNHVLHAFLSYPIKLHSSIAGDITFKVNNLLNSHYSYPGFLGYDIPTSPRQYSLGLAFSY
jgi:outer membrane receptor for ferrienterochelin and colicins